MTATSSRSQSTPAATVLLRATILIASYFLLWHFARVCEIATAASAFYPSAGVLVFFIHRWGAGYLPAAALAMLLVDISQSFGAGWEFSTMHLVRQLCVYGGLALLARRQHWLDFPIHSLHGALRLTAFCFTASLLSALWALGLFWHFLPELREQLTIIMLAFWVGDFSGSLMFLSGASVALAIARRRRVQHADRTGTPPSRLILAASTLAVVFLMAAMTMSGLLKSYSYLILLPVIAGAIAFGLNFGIASAILTNLSAVLTYVALGSHQMEPIQLQSLCAVVMCVGMLLGAAIDDRHTARFDAWHDPLTGLLNRRAFFDLGDTLLAQTRRNGSGLAAIAIDLDYFKLVNDQWGHDAGDRLLCAVAVCCRSVTRKGDLCARMGGEEFVMLVECDTADVAAAIAERLRQLVLQLKRGSSNEAMTASFGVSWLGDTLTNLNDLLVDADRLLYVAKETGRNCVVVNPTAKIA
jgi:diguanylate cyclase (GGDEF)-like protein